MPTIVISKSMVLPTLEAIPNGKFFHFRYLRKAPKCEVCGKSNAKWQGLKECPHCHAPLSYERESCGQNGVKHPTHCNAPNGTGETNAEAKANGRFKYFDPLLVNPDGSRGGYRQCYIDNVTRIAWDGNEYLVQ